MLTDDVTERSIERANWGPWPDNLRDTLPEAHYNALVQIVADYERTRADLAYWTLRVHLMYEELGLIRPTPERPDVECPQCGGTGRVAKETPTDGD